MILQVNINIDDNLDIENKDYDPDKGLVVKLFDIKNFKDNFDISY